MAKQEEPTEKQTHRLVCAASTAWVCAAAMLYLHFPDLFLQKSLLACMRLLKDIYRSNRCDPLQQHVRCQLSHEVQKAPTLESQVVAPPATTMNLREVWGRWLFGSGPLLQSVLLRRHASCWLLKSYNKQSYGCCKYTASYHIYLMQGHMPFCSVTFQKCMHLCYHCSHICTEYGISFASADTMTKQSKREIGIAAINALCKSSYPLDFAQSRGTG